METLRFLMVTTFYPPYHLGGDAVHVRYLAEALARQGHEVHVEFSPAAYRLKRGDSPSESNRDEDIQLHPIPSPLGAAQPLASYLVGQAPSVTRFHAGLMDAVDPDVVHYHNISLLGLGVLEGRRVERELLTLHDYWIQCPRSDLFKYGRYPCDAPTCLRCAVVSRRPPQLWRNERAWERLKRLDFVIAPSAFIMQRLRREFSCPVLHIPNFAPDGNAEGQVWDPGDYYLYAGVLEPHKGIMELARAAAGHPRGPAFTFVGAGTYEGRLRKMMGGSTNVKVRGRVSRSQLAHLFRNARGVILPSLWHENSPLVAIEALSWGAPLLVSRRGGLEELVHEGAAGISFEPRSDEIGSAIERFEQGGLPSKLRKPARLAYESYHRPERYLERYMQSVRGDWNGGVAELPHSNLHA